MGVHPVALSLIPVGDETPVRQAPGNGAAMPVFLLAGDAASDRLEDLERRLRAKLPGLRTVDRIEEVGRADGGPACVIVPVGPEAPSSRLARMEVARRGSPFFVFVSDDIPASDYKRLVQAGADWASTRGAPEEVAEILARVGHGAPAEAEGRPEAEPVMVAFVPSSGGVGNSTLAIEVGIQLKTAKATRGRRICLVDLDFQNSHVCDHLDVEPRMQIHEIAADPDRLDAQLFDLFVSRHASGLDVLASPRSRDNSPDLGPETLEALFRMIAARYDLVLLDLPATWFSWTRPLLTASAVALVTGMNTVPGLRQVEATLKAVRATERPSAKVAVVLNRCEPRLLGGVARRHHATSLLGAEEVHFVRDDPDNAVQSVNSGVPMAGRGGRACKDIAALARIAADAKPLVAAAGRDR